VRLGKAVRFRASDIEAFIEDCVRMAAAQGPKRASAQK
jgi:predicted DNA-binding transcriptional regulator AlpA